MPTLASWRRVAVVAVAVAAAVTLTAQHQASSHFAPGERVWLDAHNCYNHDEIDRALEQPLPISIEEDLNWYQGRSVVSHGGEDVRTAPDLETYFFDKVKPIVENALKEDNRAAWPIMILHFDFKTNEPEHHKFVLALLHKYEAWLTTAPRTVTPDVPAPFTVGPVLVLTENNAQQQVDFHDDVPVGEKLLLFGSIRDAQVPGATTQEKAANAATVSAEMLIPVKATNYRRWVNFPWAVVEAGGQGNAGDWTTADETRLRALVERAHAMHLWIRFYTLNGEDGKPAAATTSAAPPRPSRDGRRRLTPRWISSRRISTSSSRASARRSSARRNPGRSSPRARRPSATSRSESTRVNRVGEGGQPPGRPRGPRAHFKTSNFEVRTSKLTWRLRRT